MAKYRLSRPRIEGKRRQVLADCAGPSPLPDLQFGGGTSPSDGLPEAQKGEPPNEGRRIQEITADRRCGFADRFRSGKTGAEGPRHQSRGEGDLGQSGRL